MAEKSGMLGSLALILPEDKVRQVREAEGQLLADKESVSQAARQAVDILDPGVGPILKDGPTPFNLGMLALGTGFPTGGKVVGLAARRAAKEREKLADAVEKIRAIRKTQEQGQLSALNKRVADLARQNAIKVGSWDGWKFPKQTRIRSKTTGKTWEVAGRTWNNSLNDYMYLIKNQEGEIVQVYANKAHDGFEVLGGPMRGVK